MDVRLDAPRRSAARYRRLAAGRGAPAQSRPPLPATGRRREEGEPAPIAIQGGNAVPLFCRSETPLADHPHDEHQADPQRQGRNAPWRCATSPTDSTGRTVVPMRAQDPHARDLATQALRLPADPAQLQPARRRRGRVRRLEQAEARQLLPGHRPVRAVHPPGVPALSDLSAPHAGEPSRAARSGSPTSTARAARREPTRYAFIVEDPEQLANRDLAERRQDEGRRTRRPRAGGARPRLPVPVPDRQYSTSRSTALHNTELVATTTAACCPSRTTSTSRAP